MKCVHLSIKTCKKKKAKEGFVVGSVGGEGILLKSGT